MDAVNLQPKTLWDRWMSWALVLTFNDTKEIKQTLRVIMYCMLM